MQSNLSITATLETELETEKVAVVERFKPESMNGLSPSRKLPLWRGLNKSQCMDYPSKESGRCGAEVTRQWRFDCTEIRATIPGGRVLPYKRLIGMCRWIGVAFSRLE